MLYGPARRISLVVVTHVRLYREGLTCALNESQRVCTIDTASGRAEAVALIERAAPEVALIDIGMPEALALMHELRVGHSRTRVVAFGLADDVSAVVDCVAAGASGYVSANASLEELIVALDRTAAGELLCSARIAAELFRRIAENGSAAGLIREQRLPTPREREVLTLLAQCLSNKQIAETLGIAESTVKNHVHNLLEKLHVSSRNAAARVLRAHSHLSPQPDIAPARCAG
jgi:two-component system nitrate/nitrite response regulator NarL